jgi:hypothetical protein
LSAALAAIVRNFETLDLPASSMISIRSMTSGSASFAASLPRKSARAFLSVDTFLSLTKKRANVSVPSLCASQDLMRACWLTVVMMPPVIHSSSADNSRFSSSP